MARNKPPTRMPPRRRRLGRTDYRSRLALVKSGKPRLVIRRTNRYIIAQLIEPRKGGDYTVLTVTSKMLTKHGWMGGLKSLPAAYLTGLAAGRMALAKGYDEAVVDIGRHTAHKGSRLFAAVKGAVDAGLSIPLGDGVFPAEERLRGNHIKEYSEKDRSGHSASQFGNTSADFLSNLPQIFEEIKHRILSQSPGPVLG